MIKINAAIIGGAGYTGGELIRILLHHPNVQLQYVHSESQKGKPLFSIHDDLIGETDLVFTDQISKNIDVLFLCMGHGRSRVFLDKNKFSEEVTIIDLSSDFRIKSEDHNFVYGLPELQKATIKLSNRVANCGCFATAIQLALLPLADANALDSEIHIHAITGSTGAGQSLSATSHFSWRNNNVSAYKAFQHQHVPEIIQSLKQLQPAFNKSVNFIPIRGDFTRGIFASLYTDNYWSIEELKTTFQEYYKDHPFVIISDQNPSLKQVVNTNKCILYLEKHNGKVLIISMIDNLIKGATGQAVQNMNLIFGLKETTGLNLKSVAF